MDAEQKALKWRLQAAVEWRRKALEAMEERDDARRERDDFALEVERLSVSLSSILDAWRDGHRLEQWVADHHHFDDDIVAADRIRREKAEAWDEGHVSGYYVGAGRLDVAYAPPRNNPYRDEDGE